MHLPNEYLDPKTAAGTAMAALGAVAYALTKVRQLITSPVMKTALATAGNVGKSIGGGTQRALNAFGHDYLTKMAFISALIFSAQMFNFPVSSGSSGHLIGATLAVFFLGPWGAMLSLTTVLVIQAFIYGDGGIFALGANIMNMAFFAVLCSLVIFKVSQKFNINRYIAVFLSGLSSVLLAAFICSLEIVFSGTYKFADTLTSMMSIHFLIGIGEGFITIIMVLLVQKLINWKIYNEEE